MQDRYTTYAHDSHRTPAHELVAERKEQIAQDRAALQASKDRNLQRQTAMETTPEVRIALWEARHGLALPRAPKHPLLEVVATDTKLELEQVEREQQRRALLRKSSGG